MRYPAPEKLEIIRLVEQSHLPVRAPWRSSAVTRATFYRWYDAYQRGGPEALADRPSRPSRVWNRLPAEVREQIVALALEEPELSPRELAVRFTDERRYFVSEATVYRLLKAQDLITSPAYIVVKAADEFRDDAASRRAGSRNYNTVTRTPTCACSHPESSSAGVPKPTRRLSGWTGCTPPGLGSRVSSTTASVKIKS